MRGSHPALNDRFYRTPRHLVQISVITQAELLLGIKAFPHGHRRSREVLEFLSLLEVVPWQSPAAEAFADLETVLSRSGKTIGVFDTMIAAHALSLNFTLVSNNTGHFSRLVPPLKLENRAEL